jgi:aspartyl-tRNA(Asn)/glutamyl-tRNA(Gln) amidotransferase subunit C
MPVTRSDVEHIAQLARLALDERRVPELVAQLNDILAHMEVLSKVKTTDVEGASGVGDAGLPLRKDEGPPLTLARSRDAFAPAMREGFFLVPRLATHEGLGDEDGE